jgi:hypothetical protein
MSVTSVTSVYLLFLCLFFILISTPDQDTQCSADFEIDWLILDGFKPTGTA